MAPLTLAVARPTVCRQEGRRARGQAGNGESRLRPVGANLPRCKEPPRSPSTRAARKNAKPSGPQR
eukprot:7206250-Alexandrium_andersonii.AAC.1